MKHKRSDKVTQAKAPKLSEGAKALQREFRKITPGTSDAGSLRALEISLGSRPSDVTAVIERQCFYLRKKLLPELANLRDDGVVRFRKNIGANYSQESDVFLLYVCRGLRWIWRAATPFKERQRFVDALIAASFAPGITGWSAPLTLGRIVPAPGNLRSQLALAVLENWRRFRFCANPECVAPFFLARRKDQRYCELGACTAYAQRMYSNRSYYKTKKKLKKPGKRRR